jgi:hypothetical protein
MSDRTRWVPTLVLLFASACGSSPPPLWQAGTRLRPRVFRADSGAGVLVGWHDTQLDLDCTWVPDADWNYRCVAGYFPAYLDDQCTVPAALTFGPAVPTFAVPSQPSTSPSLCVQPRPLAAQRLDVARAQSSGFLRMADGTCTSSSSSPLGSQDHRFTPLLEPVNLDTFVSGALRRDRVSARLLQYVVVGADGSEERLNTFDDTNLDSICRFDPDRRIDTCVPEESASVVLPAGNFADAACTVPLAASFTTCARPPRWVQGIEQAPDRCAPLLVVPLAIGVEASDDYSTFGGSCAPATPGSAFASPAAHRYSVGAPLPSDTFARGSLGLHGTGTLRVRTIDVDGTSVATAGFLRTPDDVGCEAVTVGALRRCAPNNSVLAEVDGSGIPFFNFYEDAACTRGVWRSPSPCTPPRVALVRSPTEIVGAFRVEAIPTGPRWTRVPGGACVPDASMLPDGVVDFRVGDPIDLTSFPVLETVVE